MQGPQMHLANQDKFLSGGVRKGFRNHFTAEVRESVRKIRVICNDPDATDSSSDDETYVGARCRRGNSIVSSGGLSKRRKVIQEIIMPIPSSSRAALMVDAESSADSSSRKRATSKSNSITNNRKQDQVNGSFHFLRGNEKSGKYKGVRWRRWRRLAESSDPVRGVGVWFDTYNTAEYTARACEKSSREVVGDSSSILARSNNRKMDAISPVDSSSCVSEDEDNRHFWPSSPSSVLDLSASSDSIPSGNFFAKTTETIDSHEDGGRQGESDAGGMHLMGFEGEPIIPSSLHDPTGFQDALFGVDLGSCTNPIDWPVLNALVGEAEEESGIFEECLNLDIDAEVLSWLNF